MLTLNAADPALAFGMRFSRFERAVDLRGCMGGGLGLVRFYDVASNDLMTLNFEKL